MKSTRIRVSALAGAWMAAVSLVAPAQEPSPETRPGSRPMAPSPSMSHLGTRMSELVGRVIQNQRAETLGKIQDLVLDEVDGRVAYAIVDFDNDKSGGKLWIVPWELLRAPQPTEANPNPMTRTYLLDLPRDRLSGAPAFASTWGAPGRNCLEIWPWPENRLVGACFGWTIPKRARDA